MTTTRAKPRPLLVRPGACFTCFGDGTCCTNIHALGPLTRSEVRELRARNKLSVVYSEDVEGHCVAPAASGGCVNLGKTGCEIHRLEGADAKPTGCKRFPYGLVATPLGGRVTTEHRCPCRTLGERPALSLADAEGSLRDRAGKLEVDRVVPSRIEVTERVRVPFETYLEIESDLIARLVAGERAEQVLGAKPLPELGEKSWAQVAVEHMDANDGTAGGEVLAWFGDALLELAAGHKPPKRPRPWAAGFERGIARSKKPRDVEALFNDWLADELWMFRWLPWCPLDVALSELATRLAIARTVQKRIAALGIRADQAAAEAVMMCELAAEGSEWPTAVADIEPRPTPDAAWLKQLTKRSTRKASASASA